MNLVNVRHGCPQWSVVLNCSPTMRVTRGRVSERRVHARTSRLLKNPLLARLLKKARMQGGAPGTRPPGWVQVRGVLSTYVAAPGTHREMGVRRWVYFSSLLGHPALTAGVSETELPTGP